MEAAVVNLVPRGGKAIVLEAGVFARRWAQICACVRHRSRPPRGSLGPGGRSGRRGRLLAEHPDAVAVFGTLMESSTGVGHDVQAIGRVVRDSQALLVVDAISGAGAMECRTDDWGIDVLVVGSQKALMMPPGLAFWRSARRPGGRSSAIEPQAFYFDLQVSSRKSLPQRTRHALDSGRHAGRRTGRNR